jgi:hypothetical protein
MRSLADCILPERITRPGARVDIRVLLETKHCNSLTGYEQEATIATRRGNALTTEDAGGCLSMRAASRIGGGVGWVIAEIERRPVVTGPENDRMRTTQRSKALPTEQR